jgi:H+-translocating NAD(P) transhydrogenase subunit beta
MIDMPQLIAILHSFVGFAATILGFSEFLKTKNQDDGYLKVIETAIEVCIGSITFIGSIIAWGKLEGKLSSSPLILCGKFRHFLNLILVMCIFTLSGLFVAYKHVGYLGGVCGVSLFLGWHLVMLAKKKMC